MDSKHYNNKNKEFVRRLCSFYASNPADIEELCSSVWLRVEEKYDTFRGDSSFKTWLFRVAESVCKNWLRNKGRSIDEVFDSELLKSLKNDDLSTR